MMHAVVIGAGFGDEGKGQTVARLAAHIANPMDGMVVRFNGGPQCGHTATVNGIRHVFSQFGSGTLQGLQTYWSAHCPFSPTAWLNERDVLAAKSVDIPRYILHGDAPIVTPWDLAANRQNARMLQNGTVGVGHGNTLQRESEFYSLLASDVRYPEVFRTKASAISDYYTSRGVVSDASVSGFIQSCLECLEFVEITAQPPQHFSNHIIYEGGQGLLLDQHIGFFPHVTRGHTSTRNLASVAQGDGIPFVFHLVTRAYLTRHGNGPIPVAYPLREPKIKETPNETNITNEYQGEFRKTLLDVSLIRYAISRDPLLRAARERGELRLVITCVDQMLEFEFCDGREIRQAPNAESFVLQIGLAVGIRNVSIGMEAA